MSDTDFMRLALQLARRGYGMTSPNPMVGALLVKGSKIIGRGWHRRAGLPHAEIEALRDAAKHGHASKGATLYVTLEPCCTHGRTPPCTDAIIAAGVRKIIVGAIDPNPKHAGRAFKRLRRAGITVIQGVLAEECTAMNEAFNHWIVRRRPFVTVKSAMTLDGKIATAAGESRWITGEKARAYGMTLRRGSDAILVGVNTVVADDPALTVRPARKRRPLRRIILDPMARTPLTAKVVRDEFARSTTIVVSKAAPGKQVSALAERVNVIVAPPAKPKIVNRRSQIDPGWLLQQLGSENITNLLVEGGGETNALFLLGGWTQRIAFFYAPKILGGRDARKAVAGPGINDLKAAVTLRAVTWKRIGPDLLLTAELESKL